MRVEYPTGYDAWKDLRRDPVDGIPPPAYRLVGRLYEIRCDVCGDACWLSRCVGCGGTGWLESDTDAQPRAVLRSSRPADEAAAPDVLAYVSGSGARTSTTAPAGAADDWTSSPATRPARSAGG